MSVPDKAREELRSRLWQLADSIGWTNLSPTAKSRQYEDWTRDQAIGGVLGRYLDKGHVRVYIKDSLLKDYTRSRLADESRPLRVLGIDETAGTATVFIKPHGRQLSDGRVICWGRADDWKSILMATHERAYSAKTARPFAAVLLHASGRLQQPDIREIVQDAASKLGIERLVWLDT